MLVHWNCVPSGSPPTDAYHLPTLIFFSQLGFVPMSALLSTPEISGAVVRRLSPQELKTAHELFSMGDQLDRFTREHGFDNELDALKSIGDTLGMSVVDMSGFEVDDSILQDFPIRLVHRHGVFPVSREDSTIKLALSNPFDVQAIDAVAAATGQFVTPLLALPQEINTLIKSHLGVGAETLDGLIAQSEEQDGIEVVGDLEFDESEAAAMAQQASVVGGKLGAENSCVVCAPGARVSQVCERSHC